MNRPLRADLGVLLNGGCVREHEFIGVVEQIGSMLQGFPNWDVGIDAEQALFFFAAIGEGDDADGFDKGIELPFRFQSKGWQLCAG